MRSGRWLVLAALAALGACGWLGARKTPPAPPPPLIVVTGSPAGSRVLIDGSPVGDAAARADQTREFIVSPGTHRVEIELDDKIVYREETYAGAGERRVVIVKSGFTR